jgi:hypothetical protein
MEASAARETREPMKPETEDSDSIRITQQFRSGQSMVYDFRSTTGRLTLRVRGRGGADDEPPTEWSIEAATSSSPDAVIVAESAATRADALQAVGRSWGEKRMAFNLPLFDWECVARAMRAVRAI